MEQKLQEMVEHLNEVVESQQQDIERLIAINEIQNLMGKYEHYHSAGMHEETIQLFAQKSPGVWMDGPAGRYEGIEGIKRFYLGYLQVLEGDRVGIMIEHDLTTPIIEVAKDGKTAKGVWSVPGFLVNVDKTTGEPKAVLEYIKGATDFIKEDGQWKIWHFHIFTNFRAPYPYDAKNMTKPASNPYAHLHTPDKPPSYNKPYDPNSAPELVPRPPEPYETYTE